MPVTVRKSNDRRAGELGKVNIAYSTCLSFAPPELIVSDNGLLAMEHRMTDLSLACQRGLPPHIGEDFRAKDIVSNLDKAHTVGIQFQLF